MQKTPPVYAIRANDIAFGGLLRSIAAAGATPRPIIYDWPGAPSWHSSQSRHFDNPITIANPFTDEEQAVAGLLELGKQHLAEYGSAALIIPSSDTNLMLLLNHEATLLPYFKMMGAADYGSYRNEITNKGRFFELLQQSLPQHSPITHHVFDIATAERAIENAPYPVVVKPAVKDYGQRFYSAHDGLKAVIAETASALRAVLMPLLEDDFELVVQELVEFESAQDEIPFYCCADARQQIRVAATGIKEVIQPPRFGTATILELSWHQELLPIAAEIVKAIGWRGTLMIEFIRDLKDGQWKVIEVNTRPWLFHDFYRQNGLPFVTTAVRDYLGQLDTGNQCVIPRPEVLKSRPLHLDLNTLLTKTNDVPVLASLCTSQNTAQITDLLDQQSSNLTFAQGSATDRQPIYAMLEALCEQRSLDPAELKQWCDQHLDQDE